MTGTAPDAMSAARSLMDGRPGAYVEAWRRHGEPGLCARIPSGAGHWLAIGPVGEVAAWVAENYQAPAAEGSPGPSAAGSETAESPSLSPGSA